ncbi:nuclease-related domain-containing protein [Bacillus sp. SJS]|uniref:nuclease-related domain-containing protein n=1 Tax=Bacillus sp. SJS TaxID=1423321 RepID=UPI0004DCB974|nr:nuclease-related domain-containing protein [Bacillus sp. SJS]KZZ86030.1 hypothetical protein AS29_002280 [Bacillus sp. SJS]
MIIKPLTSPQALKQLEALKRRIAPGHPKMDSVIQNFAIRNVGYMGEKSLEYPLSFLDPVKYHIFHDIRMFDGTHYFQIDTLILSTSFIVILEVKNISGTLYFDSDFNQMIRVQNEVKDSFPDPLIQIRRQQAQLIKWINLRGYPHFPVKAFVVISNPRTILQASPKNQTSHEKILQNPQIPFKIAQLENEYASPNISDQEFYTLSETVSKSHTPIFSDIRNMHQIPKADIRSGVHCLKCFNLPMMYMSRRGWKCTLCGFMSKDAYRETLMDYSLLINQTITNRDARNFLQLTSNSVVKNLLNSMESKTYGNHKSRIYKLEMN